MSPTATLVTSSNESQAPNNTADGVEVGASSGSTGSLVGFYGATPIVQPATGGTAVSTTAATSTTPFGFTTSTQANAIVTLVNGLQSALVSLGLISS
jgi:hypothetical protein